MVGLCLLARGFSLVPLLLLLELPFTRCAFEIRASRAAARRVRRIHARATADRQRRPRGDVRPSRFHLFRRLWRLPPRTHHPPARPGTKDRRSPDPRRPPQAGAPLTVNHTFAPPKPTATYPRRLSTCISCEPCPEFRALFERGDTLCRPEPPRDHRTTRPSRGSVRFNPAHLSPNRERDLSMEGVSVSRRERNVDTTATFHVLDAHIRRTAGSYLVCWPVQPTHSAGTIFQA